MNGSQYISHIRKNAQCNIVAFQSNKDHCLNVAKLARSFASDFGMGDFGYAMGVLHDLGKENVQEAKQAPLKVGEKVRIKDNGMVGEVSKVSNKQVSVIIGNITSSMSPDRVERISSNDFRESSRKQFRPVEQKVDTSIMERKMQFKPEIDIRGARLSDALDAVTHYIDDAIMLNIGTVRIIHGKGTGVLREEIQKYLRTIPGLSVRDEDIRQGGTGVTIVNFD